VTNVEELLIHRDFVRGLAHRLLFDENSAADISQQTWLAAIRNPPRKGVPSKPWLAKVVRNLTINLRVGETRRKTRERDVAGDIAVPASEEIAAREETRRQVVAAVQELDETYRDVILLRFYEDLPPRKVAAALGLPVETVRTRIKRGLALLRGRLDRSHGGDGRAWALALVPLAGFKMGIPAAAATPAVTKGVASLAARAVAGAAALLVLGVSIVLFSHLREDGDEVLPALATADRPGVVSEAARGGTGAASDTFSAGLPEELPSHRLPVPPGQGGSRFVSGRVTDSKTGEPIRAFDLRLRTGDPEQAASHFWLIHKTVHDEDGRFRIPVETAGPFILQTNSSTHWDEYYYFTEEEMTGIETKLDPGTTVTGRVVCDATGEPVQGAVVGQENFAERNMIWYRSGFTELSINALTDSEGRFTLRGCPEGLEKIVAFHPDFVAVPVDRPSGPGASFEIRLKPGLCAFGRALDDNGLPIAGLPIQICSQGCSTRVVETGPDGCYRTPPVLPGKVEMKAEQHNWVPHAAICFTREIRKFELVDGDREINLGPVEYYTTWSGRLFDCSGLPLAFYTVRVSPEELYFEQSRWFDLEDRDFDRYSSCDADGCFSICKLLPGRYRIEVSVKDDRHNDCDCGMIVFDEPGTVERDIHMDGMPITGVVIDGRTGKPFTGVGEPEATANRPYSYQVIVRRGRSKEDLYSCPIGDEGRFFLNGVKPGVYNLAVEGQGIPVQLGLSLQVEKGVRITDLVLTLPPWGELRVNSSGFESVRIRQFNFFLEKDGVLFPSETFSLSEPGENSLVGESFLLETGRWKAIFDLTNLGSFEREFLISGDRTTVIDIQPDLAVPPDGLTLAGRLTLPDGSPVAGARVTLNLLDVPLLEQEHKEWLRSCGDKGLITSDIFEPGQVEIVQKGIREGLDWNALRPNDERRIAASDFSQKLRWVDLPGNPLLHYAWFSATTDAEGRFLVRSIKPGTWKTSVLAGGVGFELPNLVIPADQTEMFETELCLPVDSPTGTIRGVVTAFPSNPSPEWRSEFYLFIRNNKTGSTCFPRYFYEEAIELDIGHVPAGRYSLIITSTAFMDFESPPFEVTGGGEANLGTIRLTPCGVIRLSALKPGGKEIRCYSVTSLNTGRELPVLGRTVTNLPLGRSIIRVSASGFKDREISIDLRLGEQNELNVELEAL
jgi:RNA polymerase sigma factor (sigma-70 family)